MNRRVIIVLISLLMCLFSNMLINTLNAAAKKAPVKENISTQQQK